MISAHVYIYIYIYMYISSEINNISQTAWTRSKKTDCLKYFWLAVQNMDTKIFREVTASCIDSANHCVFLSVFIMLSTILLNKIQSHFEYYHYFNCLLSEMHVRICA
jgi:hypothetical protein